MIECGSQIAICDLPIHFDTYNGCSHACEYCFVKRKSDISQIEGNNCINSLRAFIGGKRTSNTAWCDWDIPLHWGGVSDPFQPVEEKHELSYKALGVLAETGYPYVVSTKGRLIGTPKYLDAIAATNGVVQISAACGKYDAFEHGAPPFEERLRIMERVAPKARRLIVRIQPFFPRHLYDICDELPRLAAAGVYGVTVEGMKYLKKRPDTVRLYSDFVYPADVLQRCYATIKRKAHENGLAFFCAENRLRTMGDDMCCCGIAGLDGFRGNDYNLEHLINGMTPEPTPKMKERGTGNAFCGIWQDTIKTAAVRESGMPFADVMSSADLYRSFLPVVRPDATTKRSKTK